MAGWSDETKQRYAEVLNEDMAREPGDLVREYADLRAAIREKEDEAKILAGRRYEIERWLYAYSAKTGLDTVKVEGVGTLSRKDKMVARIDPDRWPDIQLGLVGVDTAPLKDLISDITEREFKPEAGHFESVIRDSLTPGNLHVCYKQVGAKKVNDLMLAGVELPDGLSIEKVDSTGWSADKTKSVPVTSTAP